MKPCAHRKRSKKRPLHLTYGAFCLPARDQSRKFFKLNAPAKNANSLCPVKRKRALLESNPPRHNWTDGDEIKSVSTFGEDNNSPNENLGDLYFRAGACLKKLNPNRPVFPRWTNQPKTITKTALAGTRFIEANANHLNLVKVSQTRNSPISTQLHLCLPNSTIRLAPDWSHPDGAITDSSLLSDREIGALY